MTRRVEVICTGITLEFYNYGTSLPALIEKTAMPNKALHSDWQFRCAPLLPVSLDVGI